MLSGEVTKVDATEHTVHVYDPSPQHKCYLPSWECKGKPDLNKKTQPKGYHKEVATFNSEELKLVTHASDERAANPTTGVDGDESKRQCTPNGEHC